MLERLSQSGDGIKWVPADNLHLTLKFLGDVDNTDIPRMCNLNAPAFYTRGLRMHRGR